MTVTIPTNNSDAAIKVFNQLDTDDQLAFLWFVYEHMGDDITPAAPGSASPEIAGGLFEQVKQKSHSEQLEIMRQLARKQDSQISREYGSLGSDTKLAFWYYLAQGMEDGTIIPMPDDYDISEQGEELLNALEGMDFEFQITVLRNAVLPMGTEPKGGAKI